MIIDKFTIATLRTLAYQCADDDYTSAGVEPATLLALLDAFEERDALAAHAGMMTRIWFDMDDCEQDSDEQQALITQMFDVIRDHHNDPNASIARLEAKILREYADKLEADEAPDAEAGDMWDASQCADWMREQAEKAEGLQ